MSPIRVVTVVTIIFTYFALPGVSSTPLAAAVFEDKEYDRLCDEDTWLDYTYPELCGFVPQNLDIGKDLNSRGSCQDMMVKLVDEDEKDTFVQKNIVLCVFDQDNKWCLSAGDSDELREANVYSYAYNTEIKKMACVHKKKFTIPVKEKKPTEAETSSPSSPSSPSSSSYGLSGTGR